MPVNRPPLTQGCYPTGPMPVVTDPCAYLPILRAQYYALMTGNQTSQVRDGDRWQSFQPANARQLKQEIRRLEIMCDPRQLHGRTVRAGPVIPNYGGYGFQFGRRYPG